MTVNINLNNDLKTALFELACSLDKLKRQDMIEELCVKLEQLTLAKQVHCLFYNKWNMENRLRFFTQIIIIPIVYQVTKNYFSVMKQAHCSQRQISCFSLISHILLNCPVMIIFII